MRIPIGKKSFHLSPRGTVLVMTAVLLAAFMAPWPWPSTWG